MGLFVIFLTVVLFLFFVIKHSKQFFRQMKLTKIGYCLVVDKYEAQGRYFLVFQQGEQEWTLACPYKTYENVPLLTRGSLTLQGDTFHSFEI